MIVLFLKFHRSTSVMINKIVVSLYFEGFYKFFMIGYYYNTLYLNSLVINFFLFFEYSFIFFCYLFLLLRRIKFFFCLFDILFNIDFDLDI